MATALIFAGGTGSRMNAHAKPKQFLELHGKPVIIYTLEHFEFHPEIENIVVVCLESWIQNLKHLLHQYSFEKISQVVSGGLAGYDSIHNGLQALRDVCKDDDIILIHDGVRPLINKDLISNNISKVKEKGNAITVEAVIESIARLNESGKIVEIPPRAQTYITKAPQSFRYGQIRDLYQRAQNESISTTDSAHLCDIYGIELHTVNSCANNIKITTPTDYYIFRALYEAMENEQILGIN